MGRRDLAEDERVVDERAKEIHGVNQDVTLRDTGDRGVVRGVQADQNVFSVHGHKPGQGAVEQRTADLGPAAATAHGQRRQFLQGVRIGDSC